MTWDQSFTTDGLGLLLWVPSISDVFNPSESELAAGTDVTYSMRRFDDNPVYESLTLRRWRGSSGVESEPTQSVECEWVYSRVAPSVPQQLLVPGAVGFVAWRLGYPKETPVSAGQVFNGVYPVTAGAWRDGADLIASKVQRLNVTGRVGREVTVV
ncbi:phage tail tube protein [Microbacterium terrisoli]|uniref:phage tail tube protein n=1 Tax=Microbacterium terrisoli TaxID=3242192 RepID=UPI0028045438|nr:hypothetical protein [Microbacterium protaetiae]